MKKLENNVETITIEQKLSVEELKKSSKKLAEIVHHLTDLKTERSDSNKAFNDRIKSLESIMETYAFEVETAIRKTQVNVTRKANTQTNEWEFVDEKTGEIVKREPYLLPPAPLFDIIEDEETGYVDVEEEEPELV